MPDARTTWHSANGQLSREKAEVVAEAIKALLGTGHPDQTRDEAMSSAAQTSLRT